MLEELEREGALLLLEELLLLGELERELELLLLLLEGVEVDPPPELLRVFEVGVVSLLREGVVVLFALEGVVVRAGVVEELRLRVLASFEELLVRVGRVVLRVGVVVPLEPLVVFVPLLEVFVTVGRVAGRFVEPPVLPLP